MTPFRRFVFSSLMATLLIVGVPVSVSAQLGTPAYTFSAGTVIRSADVNSLFSTIYSNACNRTGCVLTGTMTTLALLPTTDNASDIGSAALSYKDAWFDGTVTIASLVVATITPTTITCTGCIGATQLAATSVSAASYGGANSIATFTVDADGRLTAAGTATPQIPIASGVTGLGTGVATALAVNVGSAGAPVLFDGALGTPSSGTLTNATGLPAASVVAGSFGAGNYVFSAGIATSGGTPSTHGIVLPSGTPASTTANLYSPDGASLYYNGNLMAVSAGTVTGSGTANRVTYWDGTSTVTSDADFTFDGTTVFATTLTATTFNGYTFNQSVASGASPTLTGTNFTGIPVSTGISGLGTGVATALAANVGSAGAPVLFDGAGGTPSSMTGTNITGIPAAGVSGTAVTLSGTQTITGDKTLSGVTALTNTGTNAVNIAGALSVGGQSSSIAAGDISAARSTTSGYINMGTDGAVYFGRTASAVVLGGASFAWGSGSAITSSDSVALLAGATFTGAITAPASSSFTTDLKVLGAEGGAATLYLWADEGDNGGDKFSLYVPDDTGTGGSLQFQRDGTTVLRYDHAYASSSGPNKLTLASAAMGPTTTPGGQIIIGYNSSGSGAASSLGLQELDGTQQYIWVDGSGDVRINTAAPTANGTTVADTAGTVVGTQTSMRSTKNIYGTYTANADSLALMLSTPLYDFDYKSGALNHQRFIGITTDDSPAFGMDLGRSFNPVSAFGHTVAAIKELERRLAVAEAELATLKGQR